MRLALLVTSPRVADGLLSASAWSVLQAGPVFLGAADLPVAATLAAAGVDVQVLARDQPLPQLARTLLEAAWSHGSASWWLGPEPDDELVQALVDLAGVRGGNAVEIDVLPGSWDLPGARLLDVVAVLDRLRSPGGCPWDAEQDHATLAKHLLEEAYEAYQAIEDADTAALRDELGDVLLQVVFHARIAAEEPGEGWTIDDVATGLVNKLVRRHPHVFGAVEVSGSDEVNANWEAIKATERAGASPLASVPMASPALTLAATLQRKADRAGLTAGPPTDRSIAELVAAVEREPTEAAAGELLWALVGRFQAQGIDPEVALRARAREFRDDLASVSKPVGGENRQRG